MKTNKEKLILGRKRVLNKWMIFLESPLSFEYQSGRGWRLREFGIIKLTSFPEEGCVFQKVNYKGFWIHFNYWLPFTFSKQ